MIDAVIELADGDHFSSAGDWKNMKPKYRPAVKVGNAIKPPNFQSQSDINKIKQLREDIVLTAQEHDKTIDALAAAKERIAELEDFRGGTIHNSWLTAPREKLIEALQFQGATIKAYSEELAAAKERERELEAYCKNTEDKLNAKEYTLLESAHDHLRRRYAESRERIAELEERERALLEALIKIEDPMSFFKARAGKTNSKLDSEMALKLSDDDWMRYIAHAALQKYVALEDYRKLETALAAAKERIGGRMKKFRFNHYGKAGPDELFYITTPAESGVYVLASEAEAEIERIKSDPDSYDAMYKRNGELQHQVVLAAERERALVDMLNKIADGLNTPWPFSDEKTEHDDILVQSAIEAGKALQEIGGIVKKDWSQFYDLPPIVKALVEALDGLYQHTKNDMQIAGLNIAAAAALDVAKEG